MGGGSGGSVFRLGRSLSGAGAMSADGGGGARGAGGGRIGVWYDLAAGAETALESGDYSKAVFTGAPVTFTQIKLEVGVSGGNLMDGSQGIICEERSPEIGVDNHSRRVDETTEARRKNGFRII